MYYLKYYYLKWKIKKFYCLRYRFCKINYIYMKGYSVKIKIINLKKERGNFF